MSKSSDCDYCVAFCQAALCPCVVCGIMQQAIRTRMDNPQQRRLYPMKFRDFFTCTKKQENMAAYCCSGTYLGIDIALETLASSFGSVYGTSILTGLNEGMLWRYRKNKECGKLCFICACSLFCPICMLCLSYQEMKEGGFENPDVVEDESGSLFQIPSPENAMSFPTTYKIKVLPS